ncbi:MAG: phage major capsid protein [Verrucomicrobia bacterium]|nr:phage major capsid protein [Verrucomicrobiota bacterium]
MKKIRNHKKMLRWAGIGMLALVAILFAVPTLGLSLVALVAPKGFLAFLGLGAKATGGCLMAIAPIAAIQKKLEAGEALTEEEFQKAVIGGLAAQQAEIESLKKNTGEIILADQSRWPAELKKAFEDLTKAKEAVNGHDSTIKEFQRKMAGLEGIIRNEVRGAFGSPVQRIANDPELRSRFNIALRLAMDQNGDMMRACAAQIKALGEDASPGTTLINTALYKEIYDTLAMYGAWNTLGVRRMGTKLTRLPIKTVRPVAKVILTEGDTLDDDANKAGTEVNLEVEVIGVLLNISLQLIQDSEFDVTADVLDDFAEAFSYRLDFLAFAADGTADATHGGMTGLFNFGTAAVAAAGNIKVASLELEDVLACRTTVDVGVLSRPCRWWMHPHILTKFALIRDKNGRSLFQTALDSPTIGSIIGAPVVSVNAAPNTDAAGAKVAVFGEQNGFVVGIRQDFGFEASDHHKWNALQRSFRGYGRAGVKGRKATAFSVLTLPAQ